MRIAAAAAALVASGVAFMAVEPLRATGAEPKPGNFVYLHDRTADGKILGFSLGADGALAALPGSPFENSADGGACGGYCQTMTWFKKRRLLITGSNAGFGVHRVLPGGALEEVAGSPFGAGAGKNLGTAVVARGRRTFVYGADGNGLIHGFELQSDDTLVELDASPFAAGDGVDGMASVKNLLFAANENATTISGYLVEADGTLTPTGPATPVTGVDFVYNVNPDPKGKVLYVAGCDQTVAAFSIDRRTGVLAAIEGGPFDAGVPECCVGVAVGKKFVFAPDNNGGPTANLQALRRARDGSLAKEGVLQSTGLAGTECCALDPRGRFLIVSDGEQVQSVAVDPRTGIATAGTPVPAVASSLNAIIVLRR